jgi:hypothetical protein
VATLDISLDDKRELIKPYSIIVEIKTIGDKKDDKKNSTTTSTTA